MSRRGGASVAHRIGAPPGQLRPPSTTGGTMTPEERIAAANAKLAHRGDKGWENPRDDQRDPEPYDPHMDRYAIGSNNPDYRISK